MTTYYLLIRLHLLSILETDLQNIKTAFLVLTKLQLTNRIIVLLRIHLFYNYYYHKITFYTVRKIDFYKRRLQILNCFLIIVKLIYFFKISACNLGSFRNNTL